MNSCCKRIRTVRNGGAPSNQRANSARLANHGQYDLGGNSGSYIIPRGVRTRAKWIHPRTAMDRARTSRQCASTAPHTESAISKVRRSSIKDEVRDQVRLP
ncbi:unnamed protein product [Prorocentrum cordatum]|uniref:Uncharacterized protein n=1 Tax=Prorocentrum cordatum TaxID=2364126 RepID=A0ABN9T374_9DINO|nr:unnamed protein product [Polarella glacialis]